MMLGIMQPYFFPYIGYWQLLSAADQYVIFDDVNYRTRGWINRNRILVDGQPHMITLPLQKASRNKLINETYIHYDAKHIADMIATIWNYYHKAPFYKKTMPLIESAIINSEQNVAKRLESVIRSVCEYLSINTKLRVSSRIDKDNSLKGKDKVIAVCKALGADQYVNAIGGQALYSKEEFAAHGIKLNFLKTDDIEYQQFDCPFVPNLSFIDVLMFNSKETIKKMLKMYTLV